MMKLTFTLAAVIFASMAIWGETDKNEQHSTVLTQDTSSNTFVTFYDRPTALDADTQVTQAVKAPLYFKTMNESMNAPQLVSLIKPLSAETLNRLNASIDRFIVTANRVNVRGGPSTSNAVVGSVVLNDYVETIGEPSGNWVKIRNLETGLTGYMSAKFLTQL